MSFEYNLHNRNLKLYVIKRKYLVICNFMLALLGFATNYCILVPDGNICLKRVKQNTLSCEYTEILNEKKKNVIQ